MTRKGDKMSHYYATETRPAINGYPCEIVLHRFNSKVDRDNFTRLSDYPAQATPAKSAARMIASAPDNLRDTGLYAEWYRGAWDHDCMFISRTW